MGKSTKKETDFWGNEKEVHYEDGNKVGETKYRETFWGNKVQDHYDSSGNKTGETRREEGIFSDKAVHYDSEGEKTGYTKNDETLFGSKIQRHYDTSGHQVGKSHYEEGFLGGHKKVHDGEYFKGGGGGGQSSSDSGSSYGDSSSTSGLGLVVVVFIFIAIFVGVLFNFMQGTGSNDRPMQSVTHVNNQQIEAPIGPIPSVQEEAPGQEATQPPAENIEKPVRTVREFRVPMNQSIAAANDFTAEVRLPDGSIEPTSIAWLSKSSETLYVTLAQDYPEGTVVTIFPKIEYSNRFVVPGNPGILTSPGVSVTVQLPDGRSFQPSVQNIERGMTHIVVTTNDSYPTGTRVIVTPVYGGY